MAKRSLFFEFGEFEIRFLCNKRKLHYEINKLYPILRALSVRMVFEILFDSLRFQPEFRSQIVFQAEFRLKFKWIIQFLKEREKLGWMSIFYDLRTFHSGWSGKQIKNLSRGKIVPRWNLEIFSIGCYFLRPKYGYQLG